MQKTCDTSFQLTFDFDSDFVAPEAVRDDNVFHLKFGEKNKLEAKSSEEDKAILEQVLINARKLKW